MSLPERDWVGQVLENRYVVLQLCGQGGMAKVYLAYDRRLSVRVAIKAPKQDPIVGDEFRRRFRREVRTLCDLEHPHLVRVLDVGEHNGVPYLVMQYLAGGSLRHRLNSACKRALLTTPDSVCLWLPAIAQALDYLHQKHHIHRDVKPENILFDKHDHPYLGDLGTVKKILVDMTAESGESRITEVGQAIGTLPYLAPEVLCGGPLTGQVDQYALAVTVYEVLSGRLPFMAQNPAQLYIAQQGTRPEPLDRLVGVSPYVAEVVEKALANDPKARFSCCCEFAEAYGQAIAGRLVISLSQGLPPASQGGLPALGRQAEPQRTHQEAERDRPLPPDTGEAQPVVSPTPSQFASWQGPPAHSYPPPPPPHAFKVGKDATDVAEITLSCPACGVPMVVPCRGVPYMASCPKCGGPIRVPRRPPRRHLRRICSRGKFLVALAIAVGATFAVAAIASWLVLVMLR